MMFTSARCGSGAALAGVVLLTTLGLAQSPAGWRGDGSGRFVSAMPAAPWTAPVGDAAGKGILWRLPMPGASNSSPVVVGDKLFVCSEPDVLLCVDAAKGTIVWSRASSGIDTLSPDARAKYDQALPDIEKRDELKARVDRIKRAMRDLEPPDVTAQPASKPGARAASAPTSSPAEIQARRDELAKELASASADLVMAQAKVKGVPQPPHWGGHEDAGGTTPTPVSDGRNVYVFHGSCVAAAYTLEGRRLWIRALSQEASPWGHTASPVLAGGRLILSHGDVTALNPADGQTVWTVKSITHYGTPGVAVIDGKALVLTAEGQMIRAEDGAMLAADLPKLTYCSPLVEGTMVYYVGVGDKEAVAVELPARADGSAKPREVWRHVLKTGRYFASPVCLDGVLYILRQSGETWALDARTGQEIWQRPWTLGGQYYPSLAAAGGKLLVTSDTGRSIILQPGKEPQIVAQNMLEPMRSCPCFAGGRLYVRGLKSLYCIGKE